MPNKEVQVFSYGRYCRSSCAAPCHRPGDPTHRPRTNVPASPPYRLKEAGRWRVAAPTGAPSSLCRNLASAARWSSRSPRAARRCPREVCRPHSASPCTGAAVVAPHASSQLAAVREVRSCCSPREVCPRRRGLTVSRLRRSPVVALPRVRCCPARVVARRLPRPRGLGDGGPAIASRCGVERTATGTGMTRP